MGQNDILYHLHKEEESKMNITTLGIDLAKTVFQLHGVDQAGNVVLRKRLTRLTLTEIAVTI